MVRAPSALGIIVGAPASNINCRARSCYNLCLVSSSSSLKLDAGQIVCSKLRTSMAATAELVVPKSIPTTFSPGATSARAVTSDAQPNEQKSLLGFLEMLIACFMAFSVYFL